MLEVDKDNDTAVPYRVVKNVPNDTITDGIGGKNQSSPEDWLLEPPRVRATYEKSLVTTNRSRYYSEFNLEEAWGRENIARSKRPLSSSGRKEYRFLMPTLT